LQIVKLVQKRRTFTLSIFVDVVAVKKTTEYLILDVPAYRKLSLMGSTELLFCTGTSENSTGTGLLWQNRYFGFYLCNIKFATNKDFASIWIEN